MHISHQPHQAAPSRTSCQQVAGLGSAGLLEQTLCMPRRTVAGTAAAAAAGAEGIEAFKPGGGGGGGAGGRGGGGHFAFTPPPPPPPPSTHLFAVQEPDASGECPVDLLLRNAVVWRTAGGVV